MTTISGPILFNNSTGSDTAASGVGPSTAVSGTGASTNNTTTVDLSADTPDLSGVSAGDLLWVDSSSGRQFSVIASVDDGADTVTCDDTFTQTEGSRNWGIGGKRKTLGNTQSRKLFSADAKPGWIIELEDDQTISSTLVISVSGDTTTGRITLRSSVSGTPRTITCSANDQNLSAGTYSYWSIEDIKFDCTNGTKTSSTGFHVTGNVSMFRFIRCIFGDATNTLGNALYRSTGTPEIVFYKCLITDCTSDAMNFPSATLKEIQFHYCRFENNTGHGIVMTNARDLIITNSIFANNSSDGINLSGSYGGTVNITGCVFYNNSGDGLEIPSGASDNVFIHNCIFVSNGGYGLNGSAAGDLAKGVTDYNAYYNNTSGARNNFTAGDNDITLTADPFVDAANNDFNINNQSGGGASLRTVAITMP